MIPANTTESNQLSLQEIKQLAATPGPCITILQPLLPAPNEARQNQARVKASIKEVERILAEKGMTAKQSQELLKPLSELIGELDFAGDFESLAVFRSPEVFRQFQLRGPLKESVTVANHPFVLPLLQLLDTDRTFHILALSQKHIRLLRCTGHSSEEIPLPASVPKTLMEDVQTDQPDHNLGNKSTGGPSTGSMKGVAFTTSTDREAKDEYLHHFYKDVDRGIRQLLKDDRSPLVLAGVEYELAIYRKINSYPHLAADAVQGAPDGLKGGELRKRALEAARSYFEGDLNKALDQFHEQSGSARASRTMKDIVECAYDGRVAHLLIAENARYMGHFDERTRVSHSHQRPLPDDEDLLNAAAIQTILHGGQVFVLPASKVPDGAPAVAVLRY